MKDRKNNIITAVIVLLVAAVAVFAVFKSEADNKETTVLTSSGNGRTLRIVMIGKPLKPYGETNCRAELYENGEKTAEQAIAVQNDGEVVSADNFRICWQEETVSVSVSGSGQEETDFVISYGVAE